MYCTVQLQSFYLKELDGLITMASHWGQYTALRNCVAGCEKLEYGGRALCA